MQKYHHEQHSDAAYVDQANYNILTNSYGESKPVIHPNDYSNQRYYHESNSLAKSESKP